MSGWGAGYVTDITYMVGWYRQQSPAMMALASIIGGSQATVPSGDDPIMLLELGCGFGYGAMALAASNPHWTVTAVDFNPAHIAAARDWAAEAGLTNITFIEADLAAWEDDPVMRGLPEMDFVTMHGVWSWVPQPTRDGIVRLLARKVRPGGLVHLSYNSLPGWQDNLGTARVIREAGRRAAGRSDQQAREGLRVMNDLITAEAHFAVNGERPKALVKRMDEAGSAYLAHEFMNENWSPCFVTDVAAALNPAKLDWVASSNLAENFPELMLTEPQREIFNRYGDPMMQELIKDMCLPRQLRHDVFVRGARRLSLPERAAGLMDVTLTLVKPVDTLPDALSVPAGRAELNVEFYRPIVNALAARPERVGDLLALPGLSGRRDNPAELLAILIGTDMVEPTARPLTEPGPEAMRFNAVTAGRLIREPLGRVVVAACRPAGTPIMTPLLALVVLNHMHAGTTDLHGLVALLEVAAEQEADARKSVESCLTRFIPMLKAAGVF